MRLTAVTTRRRSRRPLYFSIGARKKTHSRKIIGLSSIGMIAALGLSLFALRLHSQALIVPTPAPDNAITTTSQGQGLPQSDTQPLNEQSSPSSPTHQAAGRNSSVSATVSSGNGSTRVNVNGHDIPVPANGTVQKSVPSNDNQGNVSVSVQNSSNTSSSNQTGSSTNLQIFTNSSNTTTEENSSQ